MFQFKPGFYADVRIEDRFTTNISYRDGRLEECKESNVKKAFLRVFDGKMWYYVSTSDIDGVQRELDALYAAASPDKDIDKNPIVKNFECNRETAYRFQNARVDTVPLEDKQRKVTARLGDFDKSAYKKMTRALYLDRHSDYEFYSSKGAELKYDFQTCGLAYYVSFANGSETLDGMLQRAVNTFDELSVTQEDAKAFLAEHEDYLLNAKPVTGGTYPVILSPEVAGVFAHESFGHKSEADFMIGNEQMKEEWAIGKKVASDILSIYDTGAESGSGYCPFDDEGTRAAKTYLIKDGVLAGRLHSCSTAAALSESPTGNARAVSGDFEPIVRMTTTVVGPGSSTFEELVGKIKHGYYIKDFKHGSGMSTFTIAPRLAYEIKDGKLGGPVKISVITGNVFETLGLIDGLSQTVELTSFVTGGCGKMEQYPLCVGFGGPYVSVSKMTVQ